MVDSQLLYVGLHIASANSRSTCPQLSIGRLVRPQARCLPLTCDVVADVQPLRVAGQQSLLLRCSTL